jgi:cysteine sulfinate desulfinase/cysteine desulfurase-like protein
MWIFGIKNALVIGCLAGIMNVIPYIGPIITLGFAMLLGISGCIEYNQYELISSTILKIIVILISTNIIDALIVQPTIFANSATRVSNTTSVAMPGVQSEVQLMHFDLNNISVSSGAACSSGKVKASHVLKAMGVSDELSKCALRISYGWNTTEEEINQCISVWASLYDIQTKKHNEANYD